MLQGRLNSAFCFFIVTPTRQYSITCRHGKEGGAREKKKQRISSGICFYDSSSGMTKTTFSFAKSSGSTATEGNFFLISSMTPKTKESGTLAPEVMPIVSKESHSSFSRSEERRVGKGVDLGGRRIIKK